MRIKSLCLLLFLFGCSTSKELVHSSTTLDFWQFLSFSPESTNQITGEYIFSWDFGGGYLKLNNDGTYFRKEYSDVYYPNEIIEGYSGSYQIKKDTLFLKFKSFALDTSKVRTPSSADSVIYGNMSAMFVPPTTDSTSIKDRVESVLEFQNKFKNDDQFARFHETNYYFVKRMGEIIFLVRSNSKDFFLDQIEQKNGLWIDSLKNGKKYFHSHFSKIDGDQ